MKYRRLGRTGLEISEIGHGAWGIGGKQWLGGQDGESMAALHRAVELGVNFIDTALAYGDGHSERLVGELARGCGSRVWVATKVPPKNRVWPAAAGSDIKEVFPTDYIIACTEESLRNLGLETIDLQQLHVWSAEWAERDEWKRAFEELKKSGKVLFTGVSLTEHDGDSGLGAMETGLIDTVQVIYNIFDPSAEERLLPRARQLDIGVLARVPLDEGALTGAITEQTEFEKGEFREWYFRGDRKRQVAERVEALRGDLAGVPGPLAEIALRFCLSHEAVSTVIPGMRRVGHVESSCAASEDGPLPPAVLEVVRRHRWQKSFYC